MRLSTDRTKYIAIWHIGVGKDVPSSDALQVVEYFQKWMEEDGGKYELEAFLEAPVLIYYIPNRSTKTELTLKKIKVEDYAEEI